MGSTDSDTTNQHIDEIAEHGSLLDIDDAQAKYIDAETQNAPALCTPADLYADLDALEPPPAQVRLDHAEQRARMLEEDNADLRAENKKLRKAIQSLRTQSSTPCWPPTSRPSTKLHAWNYKGNTPVRIDVAVALLSLVSQSWGYLIRPHWWCSDSSRLLLTSMTPKWGEMVLSTLSIMLHPLVIGPPRANRIYPSTASC
ncbi:hypothetical protein AMAG_02163 [Allomyces macrogynus ATCC 38327]|uniref:Uncharacterized protein n=1 Tax=Allomyces macrogynus (strain ATCC 38327) TaxID=578462 RepID=A0A0L0S1C1_ALLM3|nr:hypothetical protein AMAG_02163 [Allomyces macrogynus ATCC 38327]|eukprot:KNE56343.1 hypothetical protein AMAG_02163 [Allomyces macrogynus ATCC 38327]